MAMHMWGDKDFDWEGLYNAERFINTYCYRFRIGLNTKEKYGEIRYDYLEYAFISSDTPLHSLIRPGYLHYKGYPFILILLDRYILSYVFKYSGLFKLIRKFQLSMFRRAIKLAVKKWPHLEEEITEDIEWKMECFNEI